MKQQWQMYAARFDALARRERGVVAGAVLAGLAMLGYTFLIEPQLVRYDTQTKNLAKATTDLQISEAQLIGIQAQLKDPDAVNRKALQQSRKDLDALDSKLRMVENSLVPPEKMQVFLESLLSKNRTLELLSFNTLPPTPLIERVEEKKPDARPDAKADAAPVPAAFAAPNIYKHGIEIKIAGSYNDLLMYLAEIERMPQRIIWNRNKLSTELYPRNEMTLTLYTLSLDKQWLVV
jgi:MSHA biogenesis protein MshJ